MHFKRSYKKASFLTFLEIFVLKTTSDHKSEVLGLGDQFHHLLTSSHLHHHHYHHHHHHHHHHHQYQHHHHHHHHHLWSICLYFRAKLMIAGVWVISFIICFPPLIGWNTRDTSQINNTVTGNSVVKQLDKDEIKSCSVTTFHELPPPAF